MNVTSIRLPASGSRTPATVTAATTIVLLLAVTAVASRERDWLRDRVVLSADTSPRWGPTAVELIAEGGLLVLVVLCMALAWWARRSGPGELGRILSAGAGAVSAYLTSELLKLVATQRRPCTGEGNDVVLLACPVPSDYSWPSNHATIAGALATAALLAAPRLGPVVVPVALAVAAARVVGGVHYVHDVTAGLALGALAVMVATALLSSLAERLAHRLDGIARSQSGTT